MISRDAFSLRGHSPLRLLVMAVVAALVGTIVGLSYSWLFSAVAGWGAACIVYVLWVWLAVGRMGPQATASHARREDPARPVTDLLLILASVASIGALVVIILEARALQGLQQGLLGAFAVTSVALSWMLVHTLFTLRYARLYYAPSTSTSTSSTDTTPGAITRGIDFHQDALPQYSDFAYVAFTLGMTFQVADTDLESTAMRLLVLRHGLLSYLFGSVILATLINLVAGLTG